MAQPQYDIMGALQAGVKPYEIKKYMQEKGMQDELTQLAKAQSAKPSPAQGLTPQTPDVPVNMYPAGMNNPLEQDLRNTSEAPRVPTPTPIVAAERVAPDLVTAFEQVPASAPEDVIASGQNPLGTAVRGFTAEAPKVLSRAQRAIKRQSEEPINHAITHMIGGTATSFVSPIVGAAEGLTKSMGMDTVSGAVGAVRKASDQVGEYFNDALPTQDFASANDIGSYLHAGADAIATNATQLVAGGLAARGAAVLTKAALAAKGITAANTLQKGAVIGGLTGAYGLNTAIETGSIYNDQPEDKKNFGRAAGYGAAAALLDTAGEAFVIGKSGLGKYLLDMEKDAALKATGRAGMSFADKTIQGAKTAALGYGAESIQEGTQTLIERTGAYKENIRKEYQDDDPLVMYGKIRKAISEGKNPLNDEAWKELKESAQAGGAMGGGLGGGGHALSTMMDRKNIAALASAQTDPAVRAQLANSALLAIPDGPDKQLAAEYFNDKIASGLDMDTASDLFMKPIIPQETLDMGMVPVAPRTPLQQKLARIMGQEDDETAAARLAKKNGTETATPAAEAAAEPQATETPKPDAAAKEEPAAQTPATGELETQAANIEQFISQIGETDDPDLKETVSKAKEALASVKEQMATDKQDSSAWYAKLDPEYHIELSRMWKESNPELSYEDYIKQVYDKTMAEKETAEQKTKPVEPKVPPVTPTPAPAEIKPAAEPAKETGSEATATIDTTIEPAQQEFVKGKVQKLGNLEAVKAAYPDQTAAIDQYALKLAEQMYASKDTPQQTSDTNSGKALPNLQKSNIAKHVAKLGSLEAVNKHYSAKYEQNDPRRLHAESVAAELYPEVTNDGSVQSVQQEVDGQTKEMSAVRGEDVKPAVDEITPGAMVEEAAAVAVKSGTSLKDQKKFLIENIDKAIEKSDGTGSETVTIHVPNDGTYRIKNSKEHLEAFKKNVKQMFPTKTEYTINNKVDSVTVERTAKEEASVASKVYGSAARAVEKMQAAVASGAHQFETKKEEARFHEVIAELKTIATQDQKTAGKETGDEKGAFLNQLDKAKTKKQAREMALSRPDLLTEDQYVQYGMSGLNFKVNKTKAESELLRKQHREAMKGGGTNGQVQGGRQEEVATAGAEKPAPEPTTKPGLPSLDEFDAMFAEATGQDKVDHAAEAKKQAEIALKEAAAAIKGILKNAVDPNKLSSGVTFDDEAYKQIKPHLQNAWSAAKSAYGESKEAVMDFIKKVVEAVGVEVQPYARKFYSEIIAEPAKSDQEETLESDPTISKSKFAILEQQIAERGAPPAGSTEEAFAKRFPNAPWLRASGIFKNGEFEKSPNLSPEQQMVEDALFARLIEDPEKFMQEYLNIAHPVDDYDANGKEVFRGKDKDGNPLGSFPERPGTRTMQEIMETQAVVVNPDEGRTLSKEYEFNPNEYSGATHEPLSAVTKMIGAKALITIDPRGLNQFVVLSGGGGSGKGSYYKASPELGKINKNASILFDGTMAKESKLNELIKAAGDFNKDATIVHVHRTLEGASKGIVVRKWNGAKIVYPDHNSPPVVIPGRNVGNHPASEAHYNAGPVFVKVAEKVSLGYIDFRAVFVRDLPDGKVEGEEISLDELAKEVDIKVADMSFEEFAALQADLNHTFDSDPTYNPFLEGGERYAEYHTELERYARRNGHGQADGTRPSLPEGPGTTGSIQGPQQPDSLGSSGEREQRHPGQRDEPQSVAPSEQPPTTELSNDAWLEANRARIPASAKVDIADEDGTISISAPHALEMMEKRVDKYKKLLDCLTGGKP